MSLQMQSNTGGLFTIPVRSLGCLAARLLDGFSEGHVAAVFRSSFYVQTKAGLICVGNERLKPSPLNLVTGAPASTDWPASGIGLHDPVRIGSGTLKVANRFSFPCSGASRWNPPRKITSPGPVSVERGLHAFRAACTDFIPTEGLGRFALPGYRPAREAPVAHAARGTILALRRWVASAIDSPRQVRADRVPDIAPLLGLGPGLTPSGDDFLGGIMIALYALRETEPCAQLWQRIDDSSSLVCGPVSYAHLEAASKGMGSDALHMAMIAVLDGDAQIGNTLLRNLDSIGHTSGWDAMAGVVTTLDEWVHCASRHTPQQ